MSKDQSFPTLEHQKLAIYTGVKLFTVIAGYPLDVIRSQRYISSTGTWDIIKTIFQQEGMAGFYKRGFGSSLLKMGGKEIYRSYGYEHFGHDWKSMLFNATLDTFTMPLDKIKVLQQNAVGPTTFWQSVHRMYEHGFLHESFKGASFYWGRQLSSYGLTIHFQKISETAMKDYLYKDEETLPLLPGFISAVAAGCAVATVMNPFNMALTQQQAMLGETKTPIHLLFNIAKTQGAMALMKGSSASYMFAVMGQLAYYGSKTWCQRIEEQRAVQTRLAYER